VYEDKKHFQKEDRMYVLGQTDDKRDSSMIQALPEEIKFKNIKTIARETSCL
jgi:hypothetical protein